MNTKKDKIFLVGFMGCGKSTLGKKIARSLNYDFIDLDVYIEQKANESINSIFSIKGEDYFREIEQRSLYSLETQSFIVVATGGGTPVNPGLMEWMLVHGCCVYIKMPEGALFQRLVHAAPKRPLILNKNEDELRAFIHEKMQEREAIYSQSHLVIDGMQSSATALSEVLKRKVALRELH